MGEREGGRERLCMHRKIRIALPSPPSNISAKQILYFFPFYMHNLYNMCLARAEKCVKNKLLFFHFKYLQNTFLSFTTFKKQVITPNGQDMII